MLPPTGEGIPVESYFWFDITVLGRFHRHEKYHKYPYFSTIQYNLVLQCTSSLLANTRRKKKD